MESIGFSGRSHPELGRKMAMVLGVELGSCLLEEFVDGQLRVGVQAGVLVINRLEDTDPLLIPHRGSFLHCARCSKSENNGNNGLRQSLARH